MPIATIPASRRDPIGTMINRVHLELEASGELRLIAALVVRAIEDAKGGDSEALSWLRSQTAFDWIVQLTPPGMLPENVQAALVAKAGNTG
jgi:hypothetical protein